MNDDFDLWPRSIKGYRFTLRGLMGSILLIGIVLVPATWLYRTAREARRAAVDMTVAGQFCQLTFALLNYHDTYGSFPPAHIADANGRPMHSWRVLILPFMEQRVLYEQYHFNEPWNGPNNSKLHDQMPESFRAASEAPSDTYTSFVVISGPGTAFPGSRSTSESDFTDGEVILFTEITDSRVNWLEPVDIDIASGGLDPRGSGVHISAVEWREPYVGGMTCSETRVGRNVEQSVLKAFATIGGGEPVTRDMLRPGE